ncbi:uncharacterized protein LOC144171883 isoform X2 [Haemaphysalis longicornis]
MIALQRTGLASDVTCQPQGPSPGEPLPAADAVAMGGASCRALVLLLALVQPSLQGKLIKAALAAAAAGGFTLFPILLPIPVEETLYYPVHYFLPLPYEQQHRSHQRAHRAHHHHNGLAPVLQGTRKVAHKSHGHAKKHRRHGYRR